MNNYLTQPLQNDFNKHKRSFESNSTVTGFITSIDNINYDGHNNNYDRHKTTSEIYDAENPTLISLALPNF